MKITYKEKKFKIPRKAEIKNIFMKHHDSHLHQGRDGTYYSIINDNYYWIGIKNDIDNYKKIVLHAPN